MYNLRSHFPDPDICFDEWITAFDDVVEGLSLDDRLLMLRGAIEYTQQTLQLVDAAVAINCYFSIFDKIEMLSKIEQDKIERQLGEMLPDEWLLWVSAWEDWFVEGYRPVMHH